VHQNESQSRLRQIHIFTKMSAAARVLLGVCAVALALALCGGTRLIAGWGAWYSSSLPYRQQTEALLGGHVALSTNPSDTEFDMAWSAGGVQQVWGLGVPVWRLPFEILARMFGQPTFPDRIALTLFIALVAYILLRVFTLPEGTGSFLWSRRNKNVPVLFGVADWLRRQSENPAGLVVVILLIAFPPMITLSRQKFDVHEEAVTYGYYYSIALFAGTLAFCRVVLPRPSGAGRGEGLGNRATSVSDPTDQEVRNGSQESDASTSAFNVQAPALFPTPAFSVQRSAFILYLALSLFAGLIGFVRPTVLAYGGATIVVTFFCARRAGWHWSKLLLGPALFVFGIALLGWSNLERFESPLEFGHRLNLTSRELLYLSRFDAPFDHEPLWSAAKELCGALFFANNLNGFQGFAGDLFVGQSATARVRHFYTTTYDVSFLLAIVLCWLFLVVSIARRRRRTYIVSQATRFVPAAWSLIGFFPLFIFYMRYCVLSSMYLLDFAPAFAAAITSSLYLLIGESTYQRIQDRILSAAALGTVLTWWTLEIARGDHMFPATNVLSQYELAQAMQNESPEPWAVPMEFQAGTNTAGITGIRMNGTGWAVPTGNAQPIVVLFVASPASLTLDVSPIADMAITAEEYAAIRAKVGLEQLHLESLEEIPGGRRLKFRGPRSNVHRSGIQVLFLCFAPRDEFRAERSRFRLNYIACGP
jgi:hypothetical protein